MNISITGFSGTGKTTVSKLLARRLDKKLISTDEEIAKKTNMSPEKFVKKYGWDKLREVESDVIENLSDLDDFVLDAGSGVILRNENVINLKKNGLIVFLTADSKTIASRIRNHQEKNDFTKSNYIDKIKGVLDQCEDRYGKAADYAIDTSNLSPEEACDLIAHYVQMELQ